MKDIKFMSIDPSLSNTGIVWGYITDKGLDLEGWHLIQTEKTSKKKVRASSDLIERCRDLYEEFIDVVHLQAPKIIFAETPSGAQSFNSGKSYAISCFLIAIAHPPAIEITPTDVKKIVSGKNTATKQQVIDYVREGYPDFKLPPNKNGKGYNKGRSEHICDAICAAEAGLQTNQFKQLKAVL